MGDLEEEEIVDYKLIPADGSGELTSSHGLTILDSFITQIQYSHTSVNLEHPNTHPNTTLTPSP